MELYFRECITFNDFLKNCSLVNSTSCHSDSNSHSLQAADSSVVNFAQPLYEKENGRLLMVII